MKKTQLKNNDRFGKKLDKTGGREPRGGEHIHCTFECGCFDWPDLGLRGKSSGEKPGPSSDDQNKKQIECVDNTLRENLDPSSHPN